MSSVSTVPLHAIDHSLLVSFSVVVRAPKSREHLRNEVALTAFYSFHCLDMDLSALGKYSRVLEGEQGSDVMQGAVSSRRNTLWWVLKFASSEGIWAKQKGEKYSQRKRERERERRLGDGVWQRVRKNESDEGTKRGNEDLSNGERGGGDARSSVLSGVWSFDRYTNLWKLGASVISHRVPFFLTGRNHVIALRVFTVALALCDVIRFIMCARRGLWEYKIHFKRQKQYVFWCHQRAFYLQYRSRSKWCDLFWLIWLQKIMTQ